MSSSSDHFVKVMLPFSYSLPENQAAFKNLIAKIDRQKISSISSKEDRNESHPVWELPDPKKISDYFLPHIEAFLTDDDKNNYLVRRTMTQEAIRSFFTFLWQEDPTQNN